MRYEEQEARGGSDEPKMDYYERQEARLRAEIDRLRATTSPSNWGVFKLKRIVIRTLRIAVGFALAVGALWSGSEALTMTDKPLGSLSLADLARLVGFGYLTFLLLTWAGKCAFGSYDVAEGWREDLERQARANILAEDFAAYEKKNRV